MSLLAPGASPTGSSASAAVAVRPKARAAAVVKRESFGLIGHSFTDQGSWGKSRAAAPRRAVFSALGPWGNVSERGGFRCHEDAALTPGQGGGFLLTLLPPGQTVPEMWSFGRGAGVIVARLRVKPPSRKHVAVAR